MKSFIAALRTLVLPFGATSGRRIVLDGTAGTITIYDVSGNKLLTLDGTNGVAVYDTAGLIRLQLALPGGSYSFLELATALSSEVDQAFLIAQGIGSAPNQRANLSLGSSDLGHGTMRWKIISRQNNTDPHIVRLDTSQLSGVTVQPILNLTGTEVGGTQPKTRVVADDYWIGDDAGEDVAPTMVMGVGRGIKDSPAWRFEKTTDTVLSTTAGTYTSIITTGNVALKAGRLYRITAKAGSYFVTGGSGFVVTDTWKFRIYRSIGGGAAATMRVNKTIRAEVAVATVKTIPDLFGLFSPAVDGNTSFIFEASKTAGAATVTSTISVDGGECYSELTVEDVGSCAVGALH